MSTLAIVLLVVSAALHAGWNLIGKKVNPSVEFFLVAMGLSSLCLLPVVIFYIPLLPTIVSSVWLFIVLAGLCEVVYIWGLGGAYKHGAISIAYPLLRSLPVLFVAMFSVIFSLGEPISLIGTYGIILVAIGCFFIPIQSIKTLTPATFLNMSCLFAVFSAIGTIGYTLADNQALSVLRLMPELSLTVTEVTLLYLFFQSLSATVFGLFILILPSANSRRNFCNVFSYSFSHAMIAGIGMLLIYILVLISMAYVDNVSYVVAFRQLSIPITVLLGVYLFKELKSPFKLLGTVATVTGIILISVK